MSTPNSKPQSRTAYHREYQRRRREAKTIRPVQVNLTAEEHVLLEACLQKQRGPLQGALKRFLLTGAAFCANSGTRTGCKITRGTGGSYGSTGPKKQQKPTEQV